MLPFRPAAPENCISPPFIRAAPGPASAALQRLCALRVVEMSQPQPSGYFNHYYPSLYGNPFDTECTEYHQPSGVVWSVHPVSGVRPQMYPVDTAWEALVDPSTRIEAVTPANSPTPAPDKAASGDQTAVNTETEVEADDVGESHRDDTVTKADGRRPTSRNATKVSGGARKIRKRLIFNTEQLQIMRCRFDIDPYIGRSEACGLARELGVATKPLLTWFANERRRVRNASDPLATSERHKLCACPQAKGLFYPGPLTGLDAASMQKGAPQ